MKTVKIAGVPEHFNFPWNLSIQNGEFQSENIDLQWTNVPEGTGKLCQMLRDGSTDIAVILTEGIFKDIYAGNPSKIVQVYVKSPLIWGIHVWAQSNFHTLEDLKNTKAAISRKGSGSELMAYVNADNQKWPSEELQFEIVNTIDGAVTSLSNNEADYFMWEHFMTKPLVDKGVFRRIADCPTPWPSFVIAVRNEFLENHSEILEAILKIINNTTLNFKQVPKIDELLAQNFNQKISDIQEWLKLTEWSQQNLTETEYLEIQNKLINLKIVNSKSSFADVVKAL